MKLFIATVIVALCESFPVDDRSHKKCSYEYNGKVLNCTNRGLTEIPKEVINAGNIFVLFLQNNKITDLPVGIFDIFTNLQTLILLDNEITNLQLGLFDALLNLQQIFLDNNDITSLPLGLFDALSNLKFLFLQVNEITNPQLGMFDALLNLQRMLLNKNEITNLPLGLFNALSNLKILYLNHNDITSLPHGLFDALLNLEALYIMGNPLSSLSIELFAKLRSLKLLSLPVICNCTENQMYLLPFILNAPFGTAVYNNYIDIKSEWIYLTNNCNSTCLDLQYCAQIETCIAEDLTTHLPKQLISEGAPSMDMTDSTTHRPIPEGAPSMDMTETTSHSPAQLISTDAPLMDMPGTIFTVFASIVGSTASIVILYQVSSWIYVTVNIVRTRTVTENQMEGMINELLFMDYENTDDRAKCRNVPPISHQGMIFHM